MADTSPPRPGRRPKNAAPAAEVPPAVPERPAESKERFLFDRLAVPEQHRLLEQFAAGLRRMFDDPDFTKERMLADLNDARPGKPAVDIRQFDNLLRRLHKEGYLRLRFRRDADLSQKLRDRFPGVDVTAVAGGGEENFARIAAEVFIRRLITIGKARKKTINVGIVSGRTTGNVVRAATRLEWREELEVDAAQLPDSICVFALNVCPTEPKHLPNNATILAYELAERINKELAKAGGKDGKAGAKQASPYGLSAPLWVRVSDLPGVDATPQTFEVVRVTEPFRVTEKLRAVSPGERPPVEAETKLDLVLTGVGEPPPPTESASPESQSIFYWLADEYRRDRERRDGAVRPTPGFSLARFCREQGVVGDIAFTAINSSGTPVALRLPRAGAPDGAPADEEYMFYTAVRLPILQAMVRDPNKAVILVARQGATSKVPAIRASLIEGQSYASVLVVDEATGRALAE